MASTAGDVKGVPISAAKSDASDRVLLEVAPGLGEWLREADVNQHVACESWFKRVEEFEVVDREHGSVFAFEESSLELGDAAPGGFNWLTVGNSSTARGVRIALEPLVVELVPGSGLLFGTPRCRRRVVCGVRVRSRPLFWDAVLSVRYGVGNLPSLR